MNIKLNESNEIRLRYVVADSKSPDAWDDSFWTKGGTLVDIYGLEQNIDIFDDSKSAENLAHEVLKDIQDSEVFVVSIDEGGTTDFIKRISESKDSQDNLKESNSGVLYAIAYCEDPDIYSNDFWCWDTESDVGYELMEFGSLIQDADVFDSLEAAEDRADDVLSSIFEDEVFIVGLDPYTPHNLTGFVKKVTRDSIKESKSIKEDVSPNTIKEIEWLLDGIINIGPDDKINDQADWKRLYTTASRIKKQLNKEDLDESIVNTNENTEYNPEYSNYIEEVAQRIDAGEYDDTYEVCEYVAKKFNKDIDTVRDDINKLISDSKFIKESTVTDSEYIEVAYICDGFTNFRVYGGGFKTSDALVSVEDEKGKRLRLTMGDVCEFYTWYDAKGNVIHEPDAIDLDDDDEFEVPWGGTEERETPWSKY